MFSRKVLYVIGGAVIVTTAFFVTLRLIAGNAIDWRPTDASDAHIEFRNNESKYYTIGAVCVAYLDITYPGGITNSFNAAVGGLPCTNELALPNGPLTGNMAGYYYVVAKGASPTIAIFTNAGLSTPATNAQLSGHHIIATIVVF